MQMFQQKGKKIRSLFKCLIIFLLVSLIFSALFVDFADARVTSKKSSTAEKRSELKESTKEMVERTGSCTNYCEIDHKVPLKCGGSNDASNLQSLPTNVHKEKTAREAKLCTDEHPEYTCGGLTQISIDGFSVYMCSNGASPSYSKTYSTSTKKSSSSSTSYSTGGDGGGSSGKKCYVNGYTTKKGTYVNGYYRRC
jgi:hypothetical protein